MLNYLLLLFWPFGVLFSALKRVEHKSYRLVLSLLGFYLGYSMIIRAGSDGSRIGTRFGNNVGYSLNDFVQILANTYSGGEGNPDFYLTSISFIVSRVTDSQHFYFGVLGFIYFYFFFKFYGRLTTYLKGQGVVPNCNYLLLILIFGICLIYPFSAGINAVRFPLATFVYLYAVISFIMYEKFKYIIIAISTFLIHWAFIPMVLVLLLFLLIRNISKLYVLNFLLVMVFSTSFFLNSSVVKDTPLGGETISGKLEIYSNERYIQDREERFAKLNWYIRLANSLPYYFSILVLMLTQVSSFAIKLNKQTKAWFILSALFIIISFVIGGEADPINNRYTKISFMSSVIYLAFLYVGNPKSKLVKALMTVYIPIALFQFYTVLRTDFEVFNFVTYFGNIFVCWAAEDLKPIIDIIK